MKAITVAELVQFLQGQPQDLPIAYRLYSGYCLLETKDIEIEELGYQREDGWVADKRPDRPSQKYLIFPGN